MGNQWKFYTLFHIKSRIKRPDELQKKIFDADRLVFAQQLTELIK